MNCQRNEEYRVSRNQLAGTQGDAINAILAAAGYNFSLLLNWLRDVLCPLVAWIFSKHETAIA